MGIDRQTALRLLVGMTAAVMLFHVLVLLKVVPGDIVWGGRPRSDAELRSLEVISLLVNALLLHVLLQKAGRVRAVFSARALSVILWVFFALFVLNTLGNALAATVFERALAAVTLLNAFLIWKVNRTGVS